MSEIIYKPIGIIHTPYETTAGMPIQPRAAEGVRGNIEVFPEFAGGLKDLDGFSHIILLYHFHLSQGFKMEVKPFLDDQIRGLFATRAPSRPNPIGLSVVKLISSHDNIIQIENVDILNDTPLLDIKPYIPDFESINDLKTGWFTAVKHKLPDARNDGRFNRSGQSH
ncbi:MAG: tRNA (N6-threonylcarbamoyladenosine(37)-N6)-methyltransferase TrmO [Bacteroidales bacterium]|nr:tRNA (N6-threonylcarbamoyladenosine(37)-N6)-methyltransferase TrmO [Lentimicrobiaceae bacterium]MDD5695635.1 tRNA (N6-threonylcarbamoyladenosine(37)-N6)-methyltransferase TrmO [Bacteroidales bacterium]